MQNRSETSANATSGSSIRSNPALDGAEDGLVREMLAGSDRAWREFHARYDRLISRCIAKVTTRFSAIASQDEAREIRASLFMQLLSNDMHKLRSFDAARGNLASWVGMLAVNCAYDQLRAMRRRPPALPLTEAEARWSDLPSPDEQAERRERAALVADMLRSFSEKDCEFVELYFGEGLTPDEIAERLQISVKTVYSKRFKIQSRLEAMLSDSRIAA